MARIIDLPSDLISTKELHYIEDSHKLIGSYKAESIAMRLMTNLELIAIVNGAD